MSEWISVALVMAAIIVPVIIRLARTHSSWD